MMSSNGQPPAPGARRSRSRSRSRTRNDDDETYPTTTTAVAAAAATTTTTDRQRGARSKSPGYDGNSRRGARGYANQGYRESHNSNMHTQSSSSSSSSSSSQPLSTKTVEQLQADARRAAKAVAEREHRLKTQQAGLDEDRKAADRLQEAADKAAAAERAKAEREGRINGFVTVYKRGRGYEVHSEFNHKKIEMMKVEPRPAFSDELVMIMVAHKVNDYVTLLRAREYDTVEADAMRKAMMLHAHSMSERIRSMRKSAEAEYLHMCEHLKLEISSSQQVMHSLTSVSDAVYHAVRHLATNDAKLGPNSRVGHKHNNSGSESGSDSDDDPAPSVASVAATTNLFGFTVTGRGTTNATAKVPPPSSLSSAPSTTTVAVLDKNPDAKLLADSVSALTTDIDKANKENEVLKTAAVCAATLRDAAKAAAAVATAANTPNAAVMQEHAEHMGDSADAAEDGLREAEDRIRAMVAEHEKKENELTRLAAQDDIVAD